MRNAHEMTSGRCRKTLSAVILSASLPLLLGTAGSVANTNRQIISLPPWSLPEINLSSEKIVLGAGQSRQGGWGRYSPNERRYFPEFLPALFERTLVVAELPAGRGFEWVFTGPRAGLYLTVSNASAAVWTQFHDSPGFNLLKDKPMSFPRLASARQEFELAAGEALRALTVRLDHTLTLTIAFNGREIHRQLWVDGFQRHQLRLTGKEGMAVFNLLQPAVAKAQVKVDPAIRYQTMLGWGGITTATAYRELGPEGRRRWWEWVAQYNLLCQREYPVGGMLNLAMDNWDKVADAKAHYYGDNFPNGEISDFDYNRALQSLGGFVIFEFWDFPPWISNNAALYSKAMVDYCQTAQRRTGQPPAIVGLQNEVKMSPELIEPFASALRRGLDEAGFKQVKIHLANAPSIRGALKLLPAYRDNPRVWPLIDFSAVNEYDYQDCFRDPDQFDPMLKQWHERTSDRPFLAVELCINNGQYQSDGYSLALTMGQLYHKNLTLANAALICYCWTLLNIEQPTFGMTRSLFVSDPSAGFRPRPSSHQLRVFGAFSRHVRAGMQRLAAATSNTNLLVTAFAGNNGAATAVLLNRSTSPLLVELDWPDATFTADELTDPYRQNEVLPGGTTTAARTVTISPGGIITCTSQPLIALPKGFPVP
jgi:hypothetical protein